MWPNRNGRGSRRRRRRRRFRWLVCCSALHNSQSVLTYGGGIIANCHRKVGRGLVRPFHIMSQRIYRPSSSASLSRSATCRAQFKYCNLLHIRFISIFISARTLRHSIVIIIAERGHSFKQQPASSSKPALGWGIYSCRSDNVQDSRTGHYRTHTRPLNEIAKTLLNANYTVWH